MHTVQDSSAVSTPNTRQVLVEWANRLLRNVEGGHFTNGRNVAGLPEIRLPDTHPGGSAGGYLRPIIRIVCNGQGAKPPTDLHAVAELFCKSPEIIEQMADQLEDDERQLAELTERLAETAPLENPNDQALIAELRSTLRMFADDPQAQAVRAIQIVRRYMVPPEIVERERVISTDRRILSSELIHRVDNAIYSLGYVSAEQSEEITRLVLSVLNFESP